MGIISIFKSQIGLFTIIRVEAGEKEYQELSEHFELIVLFGTILGLIFGSIIQLFNSLFSVAISAILLIILIHYFNGFLHIDGLIDFGDMFVCLGSKNKKIDVLKDPRVGAGGTMFAILVTLLTLFSIINLPVNYLFYSILVSEILAKNSLVISASIGKASNYGIASRMINYSGRKTIVIGIFLTLLLLFLINYFIQPQYIGNFYSSVLIVATLLFVSIIIPVGLVRYSQNQIGYINGDIFGAVNELSRVGVLLTIILLIGAIT
ncbi:MAG: Adenosylcobinamide-GDP ribazoletransferase [Candidatus Heimdallarchaeota archaeon LC_2]|nr:MAG: Adenosylcobinamide-GDP ribazoletransferase [Candidatus Heimdallarchaeota archaeon LC_2]